MLLLDFSLGLSHWSRLLQSHWWNTQSWNTWKRNIRNDQFKGYWGRGWKTWITNHTHCRPRSFSKFKFYYFRGQLHVENKGCKKMYIKYGQRSKKVIFNNSVIHISNPLKTDTFYSLLLLTIHVKIPRNQILTLERCFNTYPGNKIISMKPLLWLIHIFM